MFTYGGVMKDKPITAWLTSAGRTRTWLAGQLGCTKGHLSGVDNGRITPSPILIASLERVTGIPASVWVKA